MFPGPDIDVEDAGASPSILLCGAAQGQQLQPSIVPFDLDAAIPIYFPEGMPRREFAGPPLETHPSFQ